MFLERPVHCSPARRGQRGGQRHHSQKSSNKDEKEAQAVAAHRAIRFYTSGSCGSFCRLFPSLMHIFSVSSDTVLALGKMKLP